MKSKLFVLLLVVCALAMFLGVDGGGDGWFDGR